jgi:hypothetical protein
LQEMFLRRSALIPDCVNTGQFRSASKDLAGDQTYIADHKADPSRTSVDVI